MDSGTAEKVQAKSYWESFLGLVSALSPSNIAENVAASISPFAKSVPDVEAMRKDLADSKGLADGAEALAKESEQLGEDKKDFVQEEERKLRRGGQTHGGGGRPRERVRETGRGQGGDPPGAEARRGA